MNERIKELAIQTDEYFKKQGRSFFRYQWDEKFAQLIVQKCANVCQNDDDSARILDAFGVEE